MINVGDKFTSYEEFNNKLQQYKQTVFNEYWIRDCRTIKTQAKRFPNSVVAETDMEKLVYYYLRISCIKGGRIHYRKSKIKNTSTSKQHCEAGIFVKLSSCGKYLEIKDLKEKHNHASSKESFRVLPQGLNIPETLKLSCKEALVAKGLPLRRVLKKDAVPTEKLPTESCDPADTDDIDNDADNVIVNEDQQKTVKMNNLQKDVEKESVNRSLPTTTRTTNTSQNFTYKIHNNLVLTSPIPTTIFDIPKQCDSLEKDICNIEKRVLALEKKLYNRTKIK